MKRSIKFMRAAGAVLGCIIGCWALPMAMLAQQDVTIRVDAATTVGPMKSSWNYFGYDEANYTYAPNGRKLINELAKLSREPVHIRTHFLLVTGDGKASLKFGSTNVYTEDSSGKRVYDWTIVDRILGTYVDAGAIPFVEIGFMPKAMSIRAEPYTPTWIPGAKNDDYFAGWTYPPKDYQKWAELIHEWVLHSIERFGRDEVLKWDWEVWNEPDIGYWHGTAEEYDKLYDFTAAAVKRALPDARVGGPASTGPARTKAGDFLRQFLRHCAAGKNYATGEMGAPLDFVSFHAKGRPELLNGNVVMGLASEIRDAKEGFSVLKSFPKFAHVPVVLSEADPEGCAACSARFYPQNQYRNGTLYAAYEAAAYKSLLELQRQEGVNLRGVLTWAFEFEGQPYFDGFRTLATNGIDKPVLNFFRMAGLMAGQRMKAQSTAAVMPNEIVAKGVREQPDVDALAAKSDRKITIMVWNYSDDPQADRPVAIHLNIGGMPEDVKRVLLRHYRVDEMHSNAYTLWKQMSSPQNPTAEQYEHLEHAGRLEALSSPEWLDRSAAESLQFSLPAEAISLVEITW